MSSWSKLNSLSYESAICYIRENWDTLRSYKYTSETVPVKVMKNVLDMFAIYTKGVTCFPCNSSEGKVATTLADMVPALTEEQRVVLRFITHPMFTCDFIAWTRFENMLAEVILPTIRLLSIKSSERIKEYLLMLRQNKRLIEHCSKEDVNEYIDIIKDSFLNRRPRLVDYSSIRVPSSFTKLERINQLLIYGFVVSPSISFRESKLSVIPEIPETSPIRDLTSKEFGWSFMGEPLEMCLVLKYYNLL